MTMEAYITSADDVSHKDARLPIHSHRFDFSESPRSIRLDNFSKDLQKYCTVVDMEERNGHEGMNAAVKDVTRSNIRPRARIAPTTNPIVVCIGEIVKLKMMFMIETGQEEVKISH